MTLTPAWSKKKKNGLKQTVETLEKSSLEPPIHNNTVSDLELRGGDQASDARKKEKKNKAKSSL